MFVILWEFEVKPGSEDRFLRAYGPHGAWVQLFQRDPHFRATQLQRDPARPLCYFTIDFWDSETAYNLFLAENQSSYLELDRRYAELTLHERRFLSFHFNLPPSSPT